MSSGSSSAVPVATMPRVSHQAIREAWSEAIGIAMQGRPSTSACSRLSPPLAMTSRRNAELFAKFVPRRIAQYLQHRQRFDVGGESRPRDEADAFTAPRQTLRETREQRRQVSRVRRAHCLRRA